MKAFLRPDSRRGPRYGSYIGLGSRSSRPPEASLTGTVGIPSTQHPENFPAATYTFGHVLAFAIFLRDSRCTLRTRLVRAYSSGIDRRDGCFRISRRTGDLYHRGGLRISAVLLSARPQSSYPFRARISTLVGTETALAFSRALALLLIRVQGKQLRPSLDHSSGVSTGRVKREHPLR